MDDIFVYILPLPGKVKEMVTPCADGYTIYIDDKLSSEQRIIRYHHALEHVYHRDFDSAKDVQEIERRSHGR